MYMVLQDKLISGRRITRDTTRNDLSLNFIRLSITAALHANPASKGVL